MESATCVQWKFRKLGGNVLTRRRASDLILLSSVLKGKNDQVKTYNYIVIHEIQPEVTFPEGV